MRAEDLIVLLGKQSGQSLNAMIEISDRCNEVCVHCYQEQGLKGEMTTDQIKAVMDELAAMGVLFLTLSGGEATLRPDFLDLVAHARKRAFAVRLYTNGLTMTRELAAELHKLAVHVVEISLYSHRAEIHDFVTGVPGSFERTTAGIRNLAELGVSVTVKSPMMSVNDEQIEALRELALSLGATAFSADPGPLMPRERGDRSPERLSRSAASAERAMATMTPRSAPAAPGPQLRPDMAARLCGAGSSLHIEPNGELRPCAMLDLKLGDAREGIAEARTRNADRQAMIQLGWKDLHGCRSCDLAGMCSRCFAASLADVGDALAPYPSACARTLSKYKVRTGSAAEILAREDGRTDVGPYRHVEGSRFRAIQHEITAEDEALAARLGWVRRAGGAAADPGERVRPGELVQLRRPGGNKPRLMQVPSTSAVSSSSPSVVDAQAPQTSA